MVLKDLIKRCLGLVRCQLRGVSAGAGVYVGAKVKFESGEAIKLGRGVQIRPYCDLFAETDGIGIMIGDSSDIGTRNRICGNVRIGRSVLIGPDNYISSVDHLYEDIETPVMIQGSYSPHANGHECLSIGDGSWIGCHCAIIGDVHIGSHCVIGANSVVTRDIPDFSIVVGAPAKIIKQYNTKNGTWNSI